MKHKKRIVQFSTCEVYGITSARAFGKDSAKYPTPFAEDETPLIMGPVKNHRWIYACAKQLSKRVLHAYGLEEGLNYSIIRPFNFIGPRIDYLPSEQTGNPRVFSHFMNALLYGTPMKLVDGGMNYRAYTYIDDAVDCIVRIIENRGGVCDHEIFNIGTPENEVTIKDLAHKMYAIFDKHFRQPGDPYPEIISVSSEEFYGKGYEDCDRRIPDVSKARKLVGWKSRHDLDSVLVSHDEVFRGQAPRETADRRITRDSQAALTLAPKENGAYDQLRLSRAPQPRLRSGSGASWR